MSSGIVDATEAQLATRVLETMGDAYVSTSAAGAVLAWNAAAERMFGWSREEVLGRTLYELVLPLEHREAQRQRRAVEIEKVSESWEGEQLEFQVRSREGRVFFVEMSVSRVRTGSTFTFHSFLREIPERSALGPYRRIDTIVEHAADAILVTEGRYRRIIAWNRAAARMFGWTREDVLGSPVSIIIPDELRDESTELSRQARADGMPHRIETQRRRRDGSIFDVEVIVTPLDHGDEICATATYRDITERKQQERGLATLASRLRAMSDAERAALAVRRSSPAVDVLANGSYEPTGRPEAEPESTALASQPVIFALDALLAALDARDHYTGAHSEAVVDLSRAVALRLGLPERQVEEVTQTALLHDIGKVGIPDSVLLKAGPLTELEWELMREHPAIGARIVSGLKPLAHLAPAVRAEHERWDGAGYPDGLSGTVIPVASRITLACDAYHAMISDRPYRKALGHEMARERLQNNAGSQFDPDVVTALIDVLA
jgi:PAS domain S-box-containing protein